MNHTRRGRHSEATDHRGARSAPSRVKARSGAAVAAVIALVAGLVTPLLNAAPASAEVTTTVFEFTGALQTFTVPTGVSALWVQAVGGAGGDGERGLYRGGPGALVEALLPVNPGQTLDIIVGGAGSPLTSPDWSGAGGFGGGGSGGYDLGYVNGGYGGGGGGRSAVSVGSAPLVVAGGGGGGGGTYYSGAGGAGGAPNGGDGGDALVPVGNPVTSMFCDPHGVDNGCGGHGGTTTAGGAAGGGTYSDGGSPGTAGTGGDGGDGYYGDGGGGGGGGGGHYGGGGGAGSYYYGGGGGGGGSSYVNPVALQQGFHLGAGLAAGTVSITIPPIGLGRDHLPSERCTSGTVVDGTTAGVYTMLRVQPISSTTTWVCVRVVSGSTVFGGQLVVTTAPGGPGVPAVPFSDAGYLKCALPGNDAPGTHPYAQGYTGDPPDTTPWYGDVYHGPGAGTPTDPAGAYLCLQAGTVQARVVVPVSGVPTASVPNYVTWNPDPDNSVP